MLDEQSMEELRFSLSRRHLPRARAAVAGAVLRFALTQPPLCLCSFDLSNKDRIRATKKEREAV